jgi:GDP-L-fucose synthase
VTAEPFDLRGKRVWVAGHRGMVGSAITRRLTSEDCEVLTASRGELDLRDQRATFDWVAARRPHAVFLAAARVGGIHANDSYPADFLYDNLAIEMNVIEAARRAETRKLLFLGSTCIYPKFAPQPMPESALLTGELEPTNEWYAVAKIAGIKLCQAFRKQHGCNFISCMPTNLYGPNDNFDPVKSHVAAALLAKTHKAKVEGAPFIELWGSGKPRREFLHVDDLADAAVFLMKTYSGADHVNIGVGADLTIREFADVVGEVVGWRGEYRYDASKPDGTPRKLVDVARLTSLGWTAKISLREGLARTYRWYLENRAA